MSRIAMEVAKCLYCGSRFRRSVRSHPRLYCKAQCERLHNTQPVKLRFFPDAYEDREHIQLDYEGRLDE